MNRTNQISILVSTLMQGMVGLHANLNNLRAKKTSVDKDGTPVEVSKKQNLIHTTEVGVKENSHFAVGAILNEVLLVIQNYICNTIQIKKKDINLLSERSILPFKKL